MASVDLYLGFQWGVDKATITEDDGTVDPRLVSAVSLDPNTIRMTFDIAMMFLEDPGSVLKAYHWDITEQLSGAPLPILYVTKVSDTIVDVHTSNQAGVDYDVVASGVVSAWGRPLDLLYDTATFTGSAEVYPTFIEMHGFFGNDSGMQGERIDVSAPYVDNEDPAPLASGVLRAKILSFDVLDAEDQVDLTTVQIWVGGALAYSGLTDTFFAPYDAVGSARTPTINGHTFEIQKTSDWASYDNIPIRVYAEDLAHFTLDVTWTFRIEDYELPVIDTNSPTGTGVDKQALIAFSTKDVGGSGVVQSSIQVTVQGIGAVVNGLFQPGFQGVSSAITANGSNGYDVVVDREADHPSSGTVNVSASAQDVEGNTGVLSWSFTVVDHAGPLVIPLDPFNGETEVLVDTDITFEVGDDSGVDLDTIIVEVDPGTGFETAFVYADLVQFKPGWTGPRSAVTTVIGVTTIVIDKETELDVGQVVQVRVTAKDIHGNPARLT